MKLRIGEITIEDFTQADFLKLRALVQGGNSERDEELRELMTQNMMATQAQMRALQAITQQIQFQQTQPPPQLPSQAPAPITITSKPLLTGEPPPLLEPQTKKANPVLILIVVLLLSTFAGSLGVQFAKNFNFPTIQRTK